MSQENLSKEIAERLEAIESAIRVLEEYNHRKSAMKMQAVSSHLKSLFKKIFLPEEKTTDFSEKLTAAIVTLKSNYLLLEKFQKGSPKEQKLAKLAVAAIHDFNDKNETKKSPSWSHKIPFLLLKTLGIEKEDSSFPKILMPIKLSSHYEEGDEVRKNAASALKTEGVRLSLKKREVHEKPLTQELDMFRMKGIMLLKDHEIPLKVIDLAKVPVQFSGLADKETVMLSQTLLPLPGEEIELSGEFLRKQGASLRSVPQTFRMLRRSMQSGYPHPKQYAGWALSNCFIPNCPLRPEFLPLFKQFHEKKNAVAIALLPKGRLNNLAKKSLQLKEEAFNKNKTYFLNLHKKLASQFLKLVPESLISPEKSLEILDLFFGKIAEEKEAFNTLSETYSLFENQVIAFIHEKLLEKRTFDKEIMLQTKVEGYLPLYLFLEKVYEEALSDLTEEKKYLFPFKEAVDFVQLLGKIFEQSILFIFIQEAGETLEFCPPLLTLHERTVQAAAFKQAADFIKECETPPKNILEAEKLLAKRLEEDILLFGEDFEEHFSEINNLINELEEYAHARHFTKT